MSDGDGGFIIVTAHGIDMFHLLQLRSALGLEIKGLRHSKGSVYAYVKKRFGYKGNKQKVWDQLNAHILDIQSRELLEAINLDGESVQ